MRKSDQMKPDVDYLRRLGYERSDVALPTLLKWGGFLVVFCVVCAATAFLMLHVFVPELGKEPAMNPAGVMRVEQPNPELQGLPRRDLASFRAEEDKRLTQYGWVNQQAGKVHIPVDRAMDIIAQQGLPPRLPGPIPSTKPEPNLPAGIGGNPSAPNASSVIPPQPTPGAMSAPGIVGPGNTPGGAGNDASTGPPGTIRGNSH